MEKYIRIYQELNSLTSKCTGKCKELFNKHFLYKRSEQENYDVNTIMFDESEKLRQKWKRFAVIDVDAYLPKFSVDASPPTWKGNNNGRINNALERRLKRIITDTMDLSC